MLRVKKKKKIRTYNFKGFPLPQGCLLNAKKKKSFN